MSTGTDARRQILGLLTEGVEFPLPAIPMRVLLVIVEALEAAWRVVLQESPAIALDGCPEPEANAALEAGLARLLHDPTAPRPLRDVLVGVARGAECLNFDGFNLEKRPDLSLSIAGQRIPLRVECKLIDSTRGKTIALYCKNGLLRFVHGEYAWERHEALMLAYVRDGSTLDPLLVEHLKSSAQTGDPYDVLVLPFLATPTSNLAISRHQRSFTLPVVPPTTPGPIDLWHLWLGVDD